MPIADPGILLEPVEDLGHCLECEATAGEQAQHTGVCEHFESTVNAAHAIQ
ncbi:MAG: hypothetical protein K0U68_07055 [Gammaproteobacteria bacterium]|nr:hypothetical protein [Gammaproteobacteria bacterium]